MEGRLGSWSDPQADPASRHRCLFASRARASRWRRPLPSAWAQDLILRGAQPAASRTGTRCRRRRRDKAARSGSMRLAAAGAHGAPRRSSPSSSSRRKASLAHPRSLRSPWERAAGEAAPIAAHPEGALTSRWGGGGGRAGGGVVLGEEQPEEVRRGVPGSGTEERSRGRAPSASDGGVGGGGDGDLGAAAAAETDTPPGGGSAPPALKAPRSFPPSPRPPQPLRDPDLPPGPRGCQRRAVGSRSDSASVLGAPRLGR